MEVSAYTVSVRGGSLEKPCLGPPRRRRTSSSLLTLVPLPLPRTINAQHSSSSFCDKAHLRYYYDHRRHTNYSHVVSASSSNKTNKKEKEKKKKKKKTTTVVDGLSTEHKLQLLKSFSNACSISADPLHSDDNVLEEAAEVFLKRLEQLRAEEKQLKRIRKQEKANLLKAARLMDDSSSSSSSSSSESSSDSECGEVIDMSSLRSKLPSRSHQQGRHPGPDTQAAALATVPCLPTHQHQQVPERGGAAQLQNLKKGCECTTSSSSGSVDGCGTRVEVCMGNKCNKSGGAALLAEFRRQMGPDAAAVVACKCMGKCRSAPNVRVCNENDESAMAMATGTAAAVRIPIPTTNPLYIGVGLEDVSSIVDNLLGQHNIGFLQPPLPASP